MRKEPGVGRDLGTPGELEVWPHFVTVCGVWSVTAKRRIIVNLSHLCIGAQEGQLE